MANSSQTLFRFRWSAAVTPQVSLYSLLLVGIFGLALLLRVLNLGEHSLWIDEVLSLQESSDLATILIARGNAIGHLLITYGLKQFTEDVFWLRFPSVLAGLLIVWFSWKLTLQLTHSKGASLLVALAAAVHPVLLFHSRELRTYALWSAASLAASLLILKEDSPPKLRTLLLYWFTTGLVLLFHNYGIFLLGGHIAYWTFSRIITQRRWSFRYFLYWFGPFLFTGLLLLFRLFRKSKGVWNYLWTYSGDSWTNLDLFRIIGELFLTGPPFRDPEIVRGVGGVVCCAMLWTLLLLYKRHLSKPFLFFSLGVWLPVLLIVLLPIRSSPRHLIAFFPLMLVCLAAGWNLCLKWNREFSIGAAILCFVVVLPTIHSVVTQPKENWKGVCELAGSYGPILVVPSFIRLGISQCYSGQFLTPDGPIEADRLILVLSAQSSPENQSAAREVVSSLSKSYQLRSWRRADPGDIQVFWWRRREPGAQEN